MGGRFGGPLGQPRVWNNTGRSIVYVKNREKYLSSIPVCQSCGIACTVCIQGGKFSQCCMVRAKREKE